LIKNSPNWSEEPRRGLQNELGHRHGEVDDE
jgi:hypothetical protein